MKTVVWCAADYELNGERMIVGRSKRHVRRGGNRLTMCGVYIWHWAHLLPDEDALSDCRKCFRTAIE